MTKDTIIRNLSRNSDKYGNLLVELMEFAGAGNLLDVTEEQAKRFVIRKELRDMKEMERQNNERWSSR